MTSNQPYLGRCKDCDYTIFATREDLAKVEDFKGVKAGNAALVDQRGVFSRCTNRHRVFLMRPIKGTYSEDHKCDSRCLNARGWKCTCSCGGANHGRGYAATVVHTVDEMKFGPRSYTSAQQEVIDNAVATRTELTAPRLPAQLLGIEGKFIKGEAMVHDIRTVEKTHSVLYIFVTLNRQAKIKWFCPDDEDPQYDIGKVVRFRAKVKKYERDERYGNATVITELEEVEF